MSRCVAPGEGPVPVAKVRLPAGLIAVEESVTPVNDWIHAGHLSFSRGIGRHGWLASATLGAPVRDAHTASANKAKRDRRASDGAVRAEGAGISFPSIGC